MFEHLTDRIQKVFKNLRGQGKITEANVEEALQEVRLALLEADVNLETVKTFVEKIKTKALGQEVALSLTPGQVMIKIVHQELIQLLTPKDKNAYKLRFAPAPPTLILLAGLQGTGKTTTAAKLALWLKKDGRKPGLVAADLVRPAAIDQLEVLAKEIQVPIFKPETGEKTLDVCVRAVKTALQNDCNILILDTAGRLQIDQEMMNEIAEIQNKLKPTNILLVVDAMTGQNAVNVATAFHSKLPLTGLVLTKADGDSRGGAIFSITSVTGVPIQFVGVSEKMEGLEPFYPDRMASRILGMGDMLTLIEKAEEVARQNALAKKPEKTSGFDLDNMLEQIQQLTKMGSMDEIISMLPGDHTQKQKMMAQAPDAKKIKRMEAILLSMTKKERKFPQILDGSRRRRISQGSGTRPDEVNTLLRQYDMMKKVMKKGGMMGKAANLMGGGMGQGGIPPGGIPGGFSGAPGGFPGMPGR